MFKNKQKYNNSISSDEKTCSSCETSTKKPIYKRTWFIILAIIVVFGTFNSISKAINVEKFDWNTIELSYLLPKPKSNVGKLSTDSNKQLRIYVQKTSRNDYNNYFDECSQAGYTLESEKSKDYYHAYNEEGYELSLSYHESTGELCIELDSPMEMEIINWPISEISTQLPPPKSNIGNVSIESSNRLFVYIGNTTKDDFINYSNACYEKGFNIEYSRGDTYYRADSTDGYHISLSYKGNNIMSIDIEKVKEPSTENSSPTITPDSTTDIQENNNQELINGMRPEFKEAMDSYESFYDEYCDIFKQYSSNPSDLAILTKYYDLLSKAQEMDKKFNAWEGDMNDTELKYYLEVNSRVLQKMASVAE